MSFSTPARPSLDRCVPSLFSHVALLTELCSSSVTPPDDTVSVRHDAVRNKSSSTGKGFTEHKTRATDPAERDSAIAGNQKRCVHFLFRFPSKFLEL